MGEILELVLPLLLELVGPSVFDWFAERSLRWLKIW